MATLKEQVLQNMNLTPREEKFLIFHLKCILYDSTKMIMLFIFFGLIRKLDLFIFAYIALIPLRRTSGGLHLKHYMTCLIFSFAYFGALVVFLSEIKLPFYIIIVSFIVCTVIIYAIGPIRAPSRPPMSEEEISLYRKKSLISALYTILLTAVLYKTKFFSVGYWAVILHTLQLIMAYIRKNVFLVKKG